MIITIIPHRIVRFLFFIFFLFLSVFFYRTVSASPLKRIPIKKAFNGDLETHISGISQSSPPYVKVIRSQEGLEHFFKIFNQIRNYKTYKKLHWLKQELRQVDFSAFMLIAIVADPTDNYYMKFNGLYQKEDERWEVQIVYYHKDEVSYSITPKKNIHYKILQTQKSVLPLILKATEAKGEEKKEKVRVPLRSVSGVLYKGRNDEMRLVSSRTKKGRIYYIKGEWAQKLKKYAGKKVRLRGRVYHGREGPYEADFEVKKIVKIFEEE